MCGLANAFDHKETHMGYVIALTGLALLFTIILLQQVSLPKKESRAWPLLLTTTVDDGQILVAKFIGSGSSLPASLDSFTCAILLFFRGWDSSNR